MYDIRILGAIRGIEADMIADIQDDLKNLLEGHFREHGLFEIFVFERQIEFPNGTEKEDEES